MELSFLLLFICWSACSFSGSLGRRDVYRSTVRLRRAKDDFTQVRELSVVSKIVMRFADVHIKSVISNSAYEDNEVEFEVTVPKSAFISGFWLTTNNVTIRAEVKEKAEARQIYDDAKAENISAGHVSQRTELRDDVDADSFIIRVNVAGRSLVEFHLQYQELLERFTGRYRQIIYIGAQGTIPKLSVTCEIQEKENFTGLSYTTPYAPEDQYGDIVEDVTEDGFYSKQMTWEPSEEEQMEVDYGGVVKPFIIEYELELTGAGGVVFYNSMGDFVHLFSTPCSETTVMPKQMVFVIDVSGSMKGTAMAQVSVAMDLILDQLRPTDYFNIVLFSKKVVTWAREFRQAKRTSVVLAKGYLQDFLIASGDTNINDALIKAVQLFRNVEENVLGTNRPYARSIVFLTDGEPTNGVILTEEIRKNVRNANYFNETKCCKVSINTVAFGSDAARDFLRVIATENGGSATVIKHTQTPDSNEYIVESVESVQNPTIRNVKFSFATEGKIIPAENITQTDFLQYDCGSEIVIGGFTKPGIPIISNVVAEGTLGKVQFDNIPTYSTSIVNAKLLSRLVIYKRLKQFLKIAETSIDEMMQSEAQEEALQLALEHQFVTPLTSLVVPFKRRPYSDIGSYNNRAGINGISTNKVGRNNVTDYTDNQTQIDINGDKYFLNGTNSFAHPLSCGLVSVLCILLFVSM